MPPVEVQVSQTFMYFTISHIRIMAPTGLSVKNYVKMLRKQLNRADFIEKAEALMEDSRKVHTNFSEHLAKYKAERLFTLEKHADPFKRQ